MPVAKVGCNTLYPDGRLRCERHFTTRHHLRSLDILAEAGADAVEYSHAAPLGEDDLTRVSEHAKSLGLMPWSLHAWAPLPAREADIREVVQAYEGEARRVLALGVRVVVVHSSGDMQAQGLPERRRANAEALAALADMVGPGVSVAVENSDLRADWEFAIGMVRGCRAKNVGLNIDTGHANLGDLSVVEAIRMAGDLIRTTHLQDNLGAQDDHLPPGRGLIDWPAVFGSLCEAGYGGVYMIEISDCPPDREPDAVADTRTAVANVRGFLADLACVG